MIIYRKTDKEKLRRINEFLRLKAISEREDFGSGGNISILPPPTYFDFTLGLPSNFSYAGGGNTATYRNASGNLILATANVARLDHDINGNSLGIWAEQSRTNLCTNFNAIPTDSTGISTTGTVTVSQVTDISAITTYKAQNIVSGKVQQASGGASGGTVIIAGATGVTGTYAAQLVARISAGSGASFGITPSPTATLISGSAYVLYYSPSLTSTAITDTMVITIPANCTILFMLNQLEAGGNCSSVIITAGANSTRNNDIISDLSLASRPYFNLAQGTIIINITLSDITNNTSASIPFFLGNGGNSFTNCISVGILAATTRRKTISRLYVNNVQQDVSDVGSIDEANMRFPLAHSWQNGIQATMASGADTYSTFPIGTIPAIDRIYVGGQNTGSYIFGHILNLKFYTYYRTPAQLGADMVNVGEFVVSTAGQSNMYGWFSANTGANNQGEISAKATVDPIWNTTRNWIANSSTVSTTVLYYPGISGTSDWWYNASQNSTGVPFQTWINIMQGCANGIFKAIIDTSGESDAGNSTQQQFYNGMLAKFNIMRQQIGSVPVFIAPIGRNTLNLSGYEIIRLAQQQLAANNNWIYLCPERFDLALDAGGLHLTNAAYGTDAIRVCNKMLSVLGYTVTGAVDGPTITGVIRSTNVFTLTIAFSGDDTDFTPTSAIQGFQYYDLNQNNIAVSSAVRTNATTITVTLASTPPTGTGMLYYGYGSLYEITDTTKLVHGNGVNALPLAAAALAVT